MVENPYTLDRIALLTDRQREAVRLVAEHRLSKEIGPLMGISKKRADALIADACRKLQVTDRRIAARILLQAEGQKGQTQSPRDPIRLSPEPPPPPASSSDSGGGGGEAKSRTRSSLRQAAARASLGGAPDALSPLLTLTQTIALVAVVAVCVLIALAGAAGSIQALKELCKDGVDFCENHPPLPPTIPARAAKDAHHEQRHP